MNNKLYVVKYSGPFGFIKPWTAVRDSETFSQQFLTPSIVEGMEKKLFPELLKEVGIKKIVGHRLKYRQISLQQEVVQPRGWNRTKKAKKFSLKNLHLLLFVAYYSTLLFHLLLKMKKMPELLLVNIYAYAEMKTYYYLLK